MDSASKNFLVMLPAELRLDHYRKILFENIDSFTDPDKKSIFDLDPKKREQFSIFLVALDKNKFNEILLSVSLRFLRREAVFFGTDILTSDQKKYRECVKIIEDGIIEAIAYNAALQFDNRRLTDLFHKIQSRSLEILTILRDHYSFSDLAGKQVMSDRAFLEMLLADNSYFLSDSYHNILPVRELSLHISRDSKLRSAITQKSFAAERVFRLMETVDNRLSLHSSDEVKRQFNESISKQCDDVRKAHGLFYELQRSKRVKYFRRSKQSKAPMRVQDHGAAAEDVDLDDLVADLEDQTKKAKKKKKPKKKNTPQSQLLQLVTTEKTDFGKKADTESLSTESSQAQDVVSNEKTQAKKKKSKSPLAVVKPVRTELQQQQSRAKLETLFTFLPYVRNPECEIYLKGSFLTLDALGLRSGDSKDIDLDIFCDELNFEDIERNLQEKFGSAFKLEFKQETREPHYLKCFVDLGGQKFDLSFYSKAAVPWQDWVCGFDALRLKLDESLNYSDFINLVPKLTLSRGFAAHNSHVTPDQLLLDGDKYLNYNAGNFVFAMVKRILSGTLDLDFVKQSCDRDEAEKRSLYDQIEKSHKAITCDASRENIEKAHIDLAQAQEELGSHLFLKDILLRGLQHKEALVIKFQSQGIDIKEASDILEEIGLGPCQLSSVKSEAPVPIPQLPVKTPPETLVSNPQEAALN